MKEDEVPVYHWDSFFILYEGISFSSDLFKDVISNLEISLLNPKLGDIIYIDSDQVPENVVLERHGNKFIFNGFESIEDIQTIAKMLYFQADSENSNKNPRFFAISFTNSEGRRLAFPLVIEMESGGVSTRTGQPQRARYLKKPEEGTVIIDNHGRITYLSLVYPFIDDSFTYVTVDDEGNERLARISLEVASSTESVDHKYEGITTPARELSLGGSIVAFQILEEPCQS